MRTQRTMTKREALQNFNEHLKPGIIDHYGKSDRVALREEWSYFTDRLCKADHITLKQYESWSNPF